MKVLVLGGYGFIGEAICRALNEAGHDVVGLGRDIVRAERRMPFVRWLRADLRFLQTPATWAPLIAGIDAIVNAAGALQDGGGDDVAAVQAGAMTALYEAAAELRPLIVQISARTDGAGAGSPFLGSKRLADEALKSSGLPFAIFRPALVIGRNAYGGTALVRALAAFPFGAPLVHASAPVQTIALDDLASAVVCAVEGRVVRGSDIALAHPDRLALAEVVASHRAWLGLAPAPRREAPEWIAVATGFAADLAGRFGWRSPLRTTALSIMTGGVETGAVADTEPIRECLAAKPQAAGGVMLHSLAETLAANPAGVQDVWFARLYLLKPVIILVLAAFWATSGAVALLRLAQSAAYLDGAGFAPAWAAAITWATSLADLVLGALVLFRRHARLALVGMVALSLFYLASATWFSVWLWLDPLGPLVKVLPSTVLALVALAIVDER
jgi:uncharacterized protein YbjT (DUF2867 family)